jgi:hypothetical protein
MGRILAIVVAALLMTGAAAQASADERREHGRGHDGWHDRDIHRFHDHDFERWRTGHWHEGRHGGRVGWWWVLGSSWYFYPQPVYPYPDPYLPPVVVASPPAQPLYYYCARPRGYYPYVPACQVPWRAVAAG